MCPFKTPSLPLRFRATIERRGVNPHVEVPRRVVRALAPWARAGRIAVEGTLDDVEIRATLTPVAGGRRVLYVNGGMRAAASVGVGDTVSFALRPTSPAGARTPRDLAERLRLTPAAARAFRGMSASHRRELFRYIDDARTPEARRRRIDKAIEHVLRPGAPAERRSPTRALWPCPKCGNEFVNRNQWHSCARHSLDDLFRGKDPGVRALFDRYRALVESFGPVKVLPYRDKIGFMVRVRFAGAVPRSGWLDVSFWLPRRLESPRFRRIETLYPNAHIHSLRVTRTADLDHELAGWIREAYEVGRGREPG